MKKELKNPPFSVDSPEQSPGLLLYQTTTLWQKEIKKGLEPYNVSHSQFVMMAILLWWKAKDVAISQNELIATSKLDKMTVSKALKKLAQLQYVSRKEDCIDTRKKNVYLTKKGTLLARKLVPVVEDIDRAFFKKLSNVQYKVSLEILKKLSS